MLFSDSRAGLTLSPVAPHSWTLQAPPPTKHPAAPVPLPLPQAWVAAPSTHWALVDSHPHSPHWGRRQPDSHGGRPTPGPCPSVAGSHHLSLASVVPRFRSFSGEPSAVLQIWGNRWMPSWGGMYLAEFSATCVSPLVGKVCRCWRAHNARVEKASKAFCLELQSLERNRRGSRSRSVQASWPYAGH